MSQSTDSLKVQAGKEVYNAAGEKLGTVRGFDEHGFYVTADRNVEVLSDDAEIVEGSDALMWRCWECGEMGQLAGIPEECPACGAPREDIYYWQED